MKNRSTANRTSWSVNRFRTGRYIFLFFVILPLLASKSELSQAKAESVVSQASFPDIQMQTFPQQVIDIEPKAAQSSSDTSQKMNVIFIAIDDLNDWVGCMGGNPQVRTPHLDDFNAEGAMVMYNTHAPATVCCPSRSALLTGVHAYKTGVYGNMNNLKYAPKAKDLVTLPEYFSEHGYLSLSMGKIFHRHNYTDRSNDFGQWAFDEFYDNLPGMGPLSPERPVNGLPNLENEPPSYHYTAFDWGPTVHNDEKQMLDYKTAQWAADQLTDRNFEKPFFMAVGISKPHLSWYIPQKYFDMYPLEDIILPESRLDDLDDILDANGKKAYNPNWAWRRAETYNRHKEAVQAYLAAITFVDDCVGVLLDALANSEYAENTIVMIWGDHGWHLGEKLKYGKTMLWQESCRVPFMVKVPGVTPANKTCYGLVNLIDMYPTLLELCGLPANPVNDGRSFAELLRNPDMEWNEPTLTTNSYKMHRIFDGRYSYSIDERKGVEQLYDHQIDSMEWTNLVTDPQYDEIKERLKSYLPTTNEPESPKNDNLPPPEPVDTTRKVWVFPGDSVFAWQYDAFDHLAPEKRFADDTARTIGIYGCNDNSGINIRNYADAYLSEHAAQFKWDTAAQTFRKNGQWINYSIHFTSLEPYQLLLRARKQSDANFRLSIFNTTGDTVLFKDANLIDDFTKFAAGNEHTEWLISKFPILGLWGPYILQFDWYDHRGDPGIFGAFSFMKSALDLTPPGWLFVSIGTIPVGTDIVVMTAEAATVYLVPEGTAANLEAITEASLGLVEVTPYIESGITSSGLPAGNYVVYAVDAANNISEASRQIQLEAAENTAVLPVKSKMFLVYDPENNIVSIHSDNEIRKITLYDMLGKEVHNVNCNTNTYHMPYGNLLPGVYILHSLDKTGTLKREKIFVE